MGVIAAGGVEHAQLADVDVLDPDAVAASASNNAQAATDLPAPGAEQTQNTVGSPVDMRRA